MDKLTDLQDEILLKRFSKGDQDAFTEIYHRYKFLLIKVIYSMVNNQAIAEELCHDCFKAIIDYPERFDSAKASFKTYMIRIAINISINRLKKEGNQQRFVEITSIEEMAGNDGPLDGMLNEETAGELQKVLQTLSPEQRAALMLHHVEGFSYKEIADIEQTELTTIRMRVYHGAQLIKQRFAKYLNIDTTKSAKGR